MTVQLFQILSFNAWASITRVPRPESYRWQV